MLNNAVYLEELYRITETTLPLNLLNGSTLLITGASGFIGATLADVVIFYNNYKNGNINLWLMGRDEAAMKLRFKGSNDLNNVHFLINDVCHEIVINSSIDYIVHAAGKGDPRSFVEDPVGVMNANYLGMYQVLELARKKCSKKVVYISSGEVYGKHDSNFYETGMKENDYGYLDILSQRACYASAKRAAETLCISYAQQYGMDVSIARPCHTYGAAMSEKDSRVVAEFLRNAISKSDIILKSSGLQKRSYCYVPDTAEALLYIMLKGINGKAYNIANSMSVITIRELADLIATKANINILYQKADKIEEKGYSDIMNAILDSTAIEELGWRPRYNIIEGITRIMSMFGYAC